MCLIRAADGSPGVVEVTYAPEVVFRGEPLTFRPHADPNAKVTVREMTVKPKSAQRIRFQSTVDGMAEETWDFRLVRPREALRFMESDGFLQVDAVPVILLPDHLNPPPLDRRWEMVELAEEHGVYMNVETTNHGTFSSAIDGEWEENPWSAFSPDEGPVRYASEFFLNEEAVRWHRMKMRYLIARIGHSPSIAFFGGGTESEWTEAYFRSFRNVNRPAKHQPTPFRDDSFRPPFKEWTRRTVEDLLTINGHPALATTHFSTPHNGLDFWGVDNISVVYNNAYSGFFEE